MCKGASFEWSAECEEAFKSLKEQLVTPPVVAFLSFDVDFTLETDASIQGLGAILSQPQPDGKLHPVAYASRVLNKAEKKYSITELELWLLCRLFFMFIPTSTLTKSPFLRTTQLSKPY